MPAIVYDFKAIGGAMRKQHIDHWWQPAKPQPEPKAAEPEIPDWMFDPFSIGECHDRFGDTAAR